MNRFFIRTLLAVLAAAVAVPSAQTLSSERLKRVDLFFQEQVDREQIAGAVALVLQDGKPVYERAFGWADKEVNRRMTPDAIFRIASQSKALTSAVILSLMEEGRLGINEPASRYIPTFAKTTVAVANGTEVSVVPAKRAITIKDLLTHTAGISYGYETRIVAQYKEKNLGPVTGPGWYTADKDEPVCTTMERLGTLPFVAQPGEAYVYGYNTDILGCIAEKASGQPLDELIRTRITAPLHMKDTMFYLPASERNRLVTVYGSNAENGGRTSARRRPSGQGQTWTGRAGTRRRRRPALHRAGLRALPRDDPSRRRDRRRPHPLAAHGGADDDQSERDPALGHGAWLRAGVRDDRPVRRERAGRRRRVWMGRRLWIELSRRSKVAPRPGHDDQPDAERQQRRIPLPDAGVSGAAVADADRPHVASA